MPVFPDHPVVSNMERTGYPDGRTPEYPHCPVCGAEEIDEVYIDLRTGDIIGCNACVSVQSADDVNAFGDDIVCPVCKRPHAETSYSRGDKIFGCDLCIFEENAWNRHECVHQSM